MFSKFIQRQRSLNRVTALCYIFFDVFDTTGRFAPFQNEIMSMFFFYRVGPANPIGTHFRFQNANVNFYTSTLVISNSFEMAVSFKSLIYDGNDKHVKFSSKSHKANVIFLFVYHICSVWFFTRSWANTAKSTLKKFSNGSVNWLASLTTPPEIPITFTSTCATELFCASNKPTTRVYSSLF